MSIGLGGGSDREWIERLSSEGNRTNHGLPVDGEVVGCHVGPYAGLNLVNPQPGYEYIWMLNEKLITTTNLNFEGEINGGKP